MCLFCVIVELSTSDCQCGSWALLADFCGLGVFVILLDHETCYVLIKTFVQKPAFFFFFFFTWTGYKWCSWCTDSHFVIVIFTVFKWICVVYSSQLLLSSLTWIIDLSLGMAGSCQSGKQSTHSRHPELPKSWVLIYVYHHLHGGVAVCSMQSWSHRQDSSQGTPWMFCCYLSDIVCPRSSRWIW